MKKAVLSRRERCIASFALEGMNMSKRQRELFEQFDRKGLSTEQRISELKKIYAR